MSTKTQCDGCLADLSKHYSLVIHGERANGLVGGYPLPDHEFDWCETCATIAFEAVNKRFQS